MDKNDQDCTPHEGDHGHVHAEEVCGHESIRHGDHLDFEHDGHWHTKHGGHWDEHQPMAA